MANLIDRRCSCCGNIYKHEEYQSYISFCPNCLKDGFFEPYYTENGIMPCRIFLGEETIGELTSVTESSYIITSDRFDIHEHIDDTVNPYPEAADMLLYVIKEPNKVMRLKERIKRKFILENPHFRNDELEAALSLLSEQDIILLFETSKYDESVESFLGMLYDRMADGYTDSIYLVIDEIHELNYSKGSPLYNIMEKGRGKDVALIGIFQGAHETKPKQYSMLNQADMKLIFRLNDRKDAETVAESNGLKPLGEFADRILKLKKRKCLVVGNLEDDEGNLESRRFIEVEIANAY